MAFISEGAALAKLWTRCQDLTPTKKLVMQLKALIRSATNKTTFVAALVATRSRGADGKAWSNKVVYEVLDELRAGGLLDELFTCPRELLHPLAVDAASGPDAECLIAAVRSTFPEASARAYAYNYSLQTDEDAARRLWLSIYANDEAEYRRLCDLYAKDRRPFGGVHPLETWYLRTPVELEWLLTRGTPIQHGIFGVKLWGLLTNGESGPDFTPLLNNYRERRHDPAHAVIDRYLLDLDVLTGRLASVRKRVADSNDLADHERSTLLGTLEFLCARNAEAVEHYREALRLYRLHVHKRKVFLGGSHGLFSCWRCCVRAMSPCMPRFRRRSM